MTKNKMESGLTVIILVGFPACGKTTWTKNYYTDFIRVDGDQLKTSKRVASEMEVKLSLGKNVIIDATNLTKEIRVNLNNIAKRYSANTYAVVFPLSIEECMKRAKLREEQGGPHISKVVYYTMKKKYVVPTLDEGFEYIGYVEQI